MLMGSNPTYSISTKCDAVTTLFEIKKSLLIMNWKILRLNIKSLVIALLMTVISSVIANLIFIGGGGYDFLWFYGITSVEGKLEGFGFPFHFIYTNISPRQTFVPGIPGYLVAILDLFIWFVVVKMIFFAVGYFKKQ